MNAIANLIMQGTWQALLVACTFAILSQFLLPLALVAGGVIALCVLTKSDRAWLFIVLVTLVVAGVCQYVIPAKPGINFPLVLMLIPPVAIGAKILKLTESQSLMILLAICVAAFQAVLIQLLTGDAIGWWTDWVNVAITGLNNIPAEDFELDAGIEFMNGLVALVYAFAIVLSVFIGRWLQAMLFNPGGFAKEFQRIKFPLSVLITMLVVVLVTGVINENLFRDLLIVFTGCYFFQGLSVLHYTVAAMNKTNSYLLPPYLLIIFFPQFVIVGMAGVGIVDLFLNFRNP